MPLAGGSPHILPISEQTDGTDEMAKRIERVLTNDPCIGVARHVDSGYTEANYFVSEKGSNIPMA
jgi:urocanate hydratase